MRRGEVRRVTTGKKHATKIKICRQSKDVSSILSSKDPPNANVDELGTLQRCIERGRQRNETKQGRDEANRSGSRCRSWIWRCGEKKQLGCILQLLTGVVYNSRAVIVNKIHSSHTVLYNYFALFSKHRTVSDNQVAVLVWPG